MMTVVFLETLISGRITPPTLTSFVFFVKMTLDTKESVPFQFNFRKKQKQLCLMFDRHCFQPIDKLEEK